MTSLEITCPSCQSRFALKTDRMPRGPFRVVCGKCRHPFTVEPMGSRPGEPARLPPVPSVSSGGVPQPIAGARGSTPHKGEPAVRPPPPVPAPGPPPVPPAEARRKSGGNPAVQRGLGSILIEPEGRFLLGGEPVPAGEESEGRETLSAPGEGTSAETTDAVLKAPVEDFAEDLRLALLCESRADRLALVRTGLLELGYRVHNPPGAREALAWMYQNRYELVVIHEEFGAMVGGRSELLEGLRGMPMLTRRHMCVGLVGRTLRTMDNMTAFHRSVNFTVNERDLGRMKIIARTAVVDNEEFYRVFKETLKQAGRA